MKITPRQLLSLTLLLLLGGHLTQAIAAHHTNNDTAPATPRSDFVLALPWVRHVSSSSETTALHLRLMNISQQEAVLTGATSECCSKIQLSKSEKGNRSTVESITIPPGTSVSLTPETYHLQLEGLKAVPKLGGKLYFELQFEDGRTLSVVAEVRKSGIRRAHGIKLELPKAEE